jgi:hypothetical protein
MNMKYALCAIAIGALVTPALAANEFHVVQDSATKKCSIVEQKPTAATMTVVSTSIYKTQAEAEAGLKTIKVCEAK